MKVAITALLAACVSLGGCASPETARTRGDGPGADVGNRRQPVKMHEGAEPYWKTPRRIGVEPPPLQPARQAEQLSRE